MKKELAAAALLLGIFAAGLWNHRHLSRLTRLLLNEAESVSVSAEAGRWAETEQTFSRLAEGWKTAEPYTHVFIRHPEIDAVTDALCSLQGAIRSREAGSVWEASRHMQLHLTEIWEAERLSLGSIF